MHCQRHRFLWALLPTLFGWPHILFGSQRVALQKVDVEGARICFGSCNECFDGSTLPIEEGRPFFSKYCADQIKPGLKPADGIDNFIGGNP